MPRYTTFIDPMNEKIILMPEFKKEYLNGLMRSLYTKWVRHTLTNPLFIFENPENKLEKIYFDYFSEKIGSYYSITTNYKNEHWEVVNVNGNIIELKELLFKEWKCIYKRKLNSGTSLNEVYKL